MNLSLTERWLLLANVPRAELKERHRKAWQRAKRYPFPINKIYPIIVGIMDRSGPLLITSTFGRASKLSDTEFEQFIVAWKRHSNSNIRGIGILTFFPMNEVLTEEKSVAKGFVHPLEKFGIR